MAANGRELLLSANLTANSTGERTSLPSNTREHYAVLVIENNTGTTIGGVIEHSPDGENWATLHTFTGGGTDLVEFASIASFPLGNVRADMTAAGGSGADVKVEIRYDGFK